MFNLVSGAVSQVAQLPPTISIKDPDVRQFADALINVLDHRSGNTNKDSPDRFITARDLTTAVNGGGGIGSGVGGGAVAEAINNISESIRDSLLVELLQTPLQNIEAPEALVQSLRGELQSQINTLSDGITEINTITETSDSFAARTLYALKGTVEGPEGLPYAQAFIAQMDDVTVESTHAAVNDLRGLMADVYDPKTGLSKAHADILELNKVDVTSASALAQRVRVISSEVGVGAKVFIQASPPTSTVARKLVFGDLWIDTDANNAVYTYSGTQWVSTPDSRIGGSLSRIVSEETTRSTQTTALAQAINTIWSSIGSSTALIQDGTLAAISPAAVQATSWKQVQAAVTDPNTGKVSTTSIKSDLTSYVSKVDGTMNSTYSVRAQVLSNGQTVVGGFGLSATKGAGSTAGATIDFAVAADKFSVVSPTGNKSALVWSSGSLRVYDQNGRLRVKIGNLA